MPVVRFSSLDQLQPWRAAWNELAGGVPFRAWEWLAAWWRCYSPVESRSELNVLAVFADDGAVLGIAPWFRQQSARFGHVIRFLGTGEVCSDYLSLLARPQHEEAVATAVADWLSSQNEAGATQQQGAQAWDLLDISGVDSQDRTTKRLLEILAQRAHTIHSRLGPRCWRVNLPPRWSDYEAILSHSHRKQVRRLQRTYLASGRLILKTVQTAADLEEGQAVLIDLHQRRQERLGNRGCFASSPFRAFHLEIMPWLLAQNQLRLHWLELDGRQIAAEYHLASNGVVYAYQSGIDPDALEHEPGRLAAIATLQAAIEQGFAGYDFLRGDEPYKAHWRAEPRRLLEVFVVPNRASARLRYGVWAAGKGVKQWIKGRLPTAIR
ncbi:MAG TPA: GNAT family N-acetyltransferase [Pirellulales bacterium]|jgi:CelD/BcsL family acetyltransferase involved in cellulose biosynthesis|nr:GNAT family N-acetyltransferase [Pirellulales bacterium]